MDLTCKVACTYRLPATIATVPAEPVLLLTATIDPRACINTQRGDPGQRTRDYRQALQVWLAHGWFRRIVLAENSGADPAVFAAEAAAMAEHGVAFEFLACPPGDQDQARGKGFGEMGIIAAALLNSRLITDGGAMQVVVKSTGRYVQTNAGRLAALARRGLDGCAVVCDLRQQLASADSRVFAGTAAFLTQRFLPLRAMVDDARQVFFEHALARAVHAALAAGEHWRPLPCAPRIVGVGATDNRAHRLSLGKRIRHAVMRRIIAF